MKSNFSVIQTFKITRGIALRMGNFPEDIICVKEARDIVYENNIWSFLNFFHSENSLWILKKIRRVLFMQKKIARDSNEIQKESVGVSVKLIGRDY